MASLGTRSAHDARAARRTVHPHIFFARCCTNFVIMTTLYFALVPQKF